MTNTDHATCPSTTPAPVDDPRVPLRVRQRLHAPTLRGKLVGAAVAAVAVVLFGITVSVFARIPGDPFWVPLLAFVCAVVAAVAGVVTVGAVFDAAAPAREALDRAIRRLPRDPGAGSLPVTEVRLVWDGPEIAHIRRDGEPMAEVAVGRPVTTALWRDRFFAGPTPVERSAVPPATAVVRGSTRRWQLTEETARLQPGREVARAGALHHGITARHRRTDDVLELELDGRPALAVGAWLLDHRGRWWDLPPVRVADVRAGRDTVWSAPADLSDAAVAFLVWRGVAAALVAEARRETEELKRARQSTVNTMLS